MYKRQVHPQERDADERRRKAADDEHQAAHCGRALLILVPARADLANRLAELDLVQEWNHESAEQAGDCLLYTSIIVQGYCASPQRRTTSSPKISV